MGTLIEELQKDTEEIKTRNIIMQSLLTVPAQSVQKYLFGINLITKIQLNN
jgi:hypothetical protein